MNSADHAGWIQMFDGKSLAGWDGPTDLWHVEDGKIVVQSKADPPTGSVYQTTCRYFPSTEPGTPEDVLPTLRIA